MGLVSSLNTANDLLFTTLPQEKNRKLVHRDSFNMEFKTLIFSEELEIIVKHRKRNRKGNAS